MIALLLIGSLTWGLPASAADDSASVRKKLESFKRQLAAAEAELETEVGRPRAELEKLSKEIVDLETREAKMKEEIENESPELPRTDLREALNVIQVALFQKRFDRRRLERDFEQGSAPAEARLGKTIAALRKAIKESEGALAAALAAERRAREEARRRKAEEDAARLRELQAAAKAKGEPVPVELPKEDKPPPPPPPPRYDPVPPKALDVPPPPAHLSEEVRAAFAKAWNGACWFAFDPFNKKADYPRALAAARTAAMKAVPAGTVEGPEREAASSLDFASRACRLGSAPAFGYSLGIRAYEAATRVEWPLLLGRLQGDYQTLLWTRALAGCEPWLSRFWEPSATKEPDVAAFEEWTAANYAPSVEVKKVLEKLEKQDPLHPNLLLYRKILAERAAVGR